MRSIRWDTRAQFYENFVINCLRISWLTLPLLQIPGDRMGRPSRTPLFTQIVGGCTGMPSCTLLYQMARNQEWTLLRKIIIVNYWLCHRGWVRWYRICYDWLMIFGPIEWKICVVLQRSLRWDSKLDAIVGLCLWVFVTRSVFIEGQKRLIFLV